MERFLIVCACGAAGTGLRYLVALWAGERFGTTFPVAGTMIVNVVGCFLIALVMQLSLSLADFPVNLRFALTTGFIGGLTTYSSFNYETTKLVQSGEYRLALINVLGTLVVCAVSGVLGLLLARKIAGA